ncbi:hypothetical protein V9L05_12525 [Bernardetia sp. Wsw4-3y2]|uniref:DUF4870 domain-containing protein n=1 Tax=Bernardetia sp. Wsw4-3y2 TaxID=3127471 RepID=UPI0030CDCC78
MESQESRQSKNFSDIETATERSISISDKEKSNGIIAYITIIGWVIAFVQNQEQKSEYVNFHIRQMLGIGVAGIALSVVNIIPLLGWLISILGIIPLVIFWVMGLMGAINGERKPVPIIGEHFQEWFKSVGA